MKQIKILLAGMILFAMNFIFAAPVVHAHCPLCTAATGAAVAVTRFYGVDDVIVGVFIGGLIISTSLWLNNFLLKKNNGKNYFPLQAFILSAATLLLTVLSFAKAGLISLSALPYYNKVFGIDKLLLGITAGSVVTVFSPDISRFIKNRNSGKVLFPFQTIVLTFALLALTAATIYFTLIK